MMLMEVRVFLVGMIVSYQKKYLLVHSLNWVHLEYMSGRSVLSGGLKGFS